MRVNTTVTPGSDDRSASVISRIEDGEIVEDWAASDNLDVMRQLGPWRLLLLVITVLRGRRGKRSRA